MKKLTLAVLVLFQLAVAGFSQTGGGLVRVEADKRSGFSYPYYLFVPKAVRDQAGTKGIHTLLVLPNNTGKIDDDFAVHEADVKRRMAQNGPIADVLRSAILMPVFPRPKSEWRIYTHALDRDAMLTDKKEFARFDRQLVAMIDHARKRLKNEGLAFDKRVLILGFSASGMFANRFAFLHPDRVKAAAIGSPGGWPIAPVGSYKSKTLRYPIGTGDLEAVAGRKLNLTSLRKVPFFVFMGDKDDNDSVPFGDSYDDADRELMLPLLGQKPVDRWGLSKDLYKTAGLNAEFRLYPGVAHTVTVAMRDDIREFLLKHSR